MPGLVPGIHVFLRSSSEKAWMAGTSPAMANEMKIKVGRERYFAASAFSISARRRPIFSGVIGPTSL